MQPRYHLEMALLRWIHLRKLVPLTDLIDQMQGGAPRPKPEPVARPKHGDIGDRRSRDGGRRRPSSERWKRRERRRACRQRQADPVSPTATPATRTPEPAELKEAFLERDPQVEEVLSRHRRCAGAADRRRAGPLRLRVRSAASRAALAARAESLVARDDGQRAGRTQDGRRLRRGRRWSAAVHVADAQPESAPAPDRQNVLKQQALADSGVQALLDVFAAEIKDVEEM